MKDDNSPLNNPHSIKLINRAICSKFNELVRVGVMLEEARNTVFNSSGDVKPNNSSVDTSVNTGASHE